ncbi:MAG: tyrosine-type recombinase/integrase [Gammaproteobacteria bacterium]|nr:tyrosine-type recombinase/integrase [Gammaproteobacteria bacterium]
MSPTATQAWLRRWCAKHGIDPAFTPHDARRTFSTRLNDAGVEPYVVEKCLNHRMNGVMAVYNRAAYREQRIEAYRTMERLVMEVVGNG